MKEDITNELKLAFSRSSSWNLEQFGEFLKLLADSISEGMIEWDEFAGERWGRILVQEEPVIYLYRLAPLIFVQRDLQTLTSQVQNLSCLIFPNADDATFSLEPDFFEQWSNGRSKSGELDASSLSISDIWWATVL